MPDVSVPAKEIVAWVFQVVAGVLFAIFLPGAIWYLKRIESHMKRGHDHATILAHYLLWYPKSEGRMDKLERGQVNVRIALAKANIELEED